MKKTTRRRSSAVTLFAVLLLLLLPAAAMAITASEPGSQTNNTCDDHDFPEDNKSDSSPIEEDGTWGSLTWSENSLTYDINPGWTIDVCVKTGQPEGTPAGDVAPGGIYVYEGVSGNGPLPLGDETGVEDGEYPFGISHVAWDNATNGEENGDDDVTLNFQKLVCDAYDLVRGNNIDDESPDNDDTTDQGYLDWGTTVSTPVSPVSELPDGCSFASGWTFDLSFDDDTFSGDVVTTAATGENGTVSVAASDVLSGDDLDGFLHDGDRLWVSENLQDDYDFGALQCHTDALHPDNLDWIEVDETDLNEDVWCVAWNVQERETFEISPYKYWLNEDGEPTAAPDPVGTVTISANGQEATTSDGFEGESVEVEHDDEYTVTEDIPEGWVETTCPDELLTGFEGIVVGDGLGTFVFDAEFDGYHVVCNTPEDDPGDDPGSLSLRLVKLWFDADGEFDGAATRDSGAEVTFGDSTQPAGPTFAIADGTDYTVSEDDSDDWSEVACLDMGNLPEDVADGTFEGDDVISYDGTGSFTATEDGVHLVCNQLEDDVAVEALVIEDEEEVAVLEERQELAFTGLTGGAGLLTLLGLLSVGLGGALLGRTRRSTS